MAAAKPTAEPAAAKVVVEAFVAVRSPQSVSLSVHRHEKRIAVFVHDTNLPKLAIVLVFLPRVSASPI
jgi:hypothetical protein